MNTMKSPFCPEWLSVQAQPPLLGVQTISGVGPGSHSFMGGERFWNHADLSLYMEKLNQGELPVQERIQLSREEQMAEMVFMGLRLLEGVS